MKNILFLLLPTLILTGFKPKWETHEGFVEVRGGRIWYMQMGDGPGTPLIVLHGGPGGRSCGYISSYQSLAEERPVIFFDQLESGMSDKPDDTSLWKLPYFVDQLDSIQKTLSLEKFHLLGSSWGAAIAIEYLLTNDAQKVESVIFSGPLLSTPKWISDAKILLSHLPQSVQDTIKKYEDQHDYYAPSYIEATNIFYANYMNRAAPNPQRLNDCREVPPSNSKIYEYMWGPTEFTATGTLKDFDRIEELAQLKLPVLFIAGDHDEVLPETLYYFQSMVAGSKSVIVPNSGHSKINDNPEFFIAALRKFLNEVEANNK